jgi:hypothetical protein
MALWQKPMPTAVAFIGTAARAVRTGVQCEWGDHTGALVEALEGKASAVTPGTPMPDVIAYGSRMPSRPLTGLGA